MSRLAATVRGKWRALRSLAGIVRTCRNWRTVWAAWRGKRPLPELHLRTGYRIVPGADDDLVSLFQEIFLHRQYTAGFYRPRAGDVVVDLGANIGTFAVYLQHAAGGGVAVHCFEPGAETRRRLERNIAANRLGELVRVYPVGVSDARKSLTLHGNLFTGSRSTLTAPNATETGERIECVTLADAVRMTGAGRIDLLKVDIEGAEVDALSESDPDTWARIRRVSLEFHGSLVPGAREAVTRQLVGHGFRVVRVIESVPGATDGILQASR